MITTFTKEASQLINGPVGQLEIAIGEPTSQERNAWGIVCHPHPLHGGTMHNKVVTTLAKAFQGMGVTTVRFNFRGVMRSEGRFDNGNGELDDLLAVMDWVQQEKARREIWLAGFSFGSYIAARAATEVPISKLVTVAPPVQYFPMQALPPITCPWVLVQGELDDVVPAEKVFAWAEARDPKPVILRFPQAGHFFHGQLTELRTQIEAALQGL
ncbi:MAG: alpha/beta fold hydrolase [Gammaproteobacteria bacterium]|nr:alpha/beta fold hydrolase [Gammaproteobacteria bacterium]MCW5582511.1 alpha/beta fold hydrolase [Gammaproteobacteria bacterium]